MDRERDKKIGKLEVRKGKIKKDKEKEMVEKIGKYERDLAKLLDKKDKEIIRQKKII